MVKVSKIIKYSQKRFSMVEVELYNEGVTYKRDLRIKYLDENGFIQTLFLEDSEIDALLSALIEAYKKSYEQRIAKNTMRELSIVGDEKDEEINLSGRNSE